MRDSKFCAQDLMNVPLVVAPHVPFLEVLHLCVVAQVSGIPVVDAEGHVHGIVTQAELIRIVDQAYDDDVDESPFDEGDQPQRFDLLTARDLANPDIIWVAPSMPVSEVARRMLAVGAHRVLVGENGTIAGILTTFDLLRAFAPDVDRM